MEKNIYAKMLEAVAEGESVALKTEIKGTEGDIADGIKRSVGQVESTVDYSYCEGVNGQLSFF